MSESTENRMPGSEDGQRRSVSWPPAESIPDAVALPRGAAADSPAPAVQPWPPEREPFAASDGPADRADRQWDLLDVGLFLLFALGTMVLVGSVVLGGFLLLNRVFSWGLTLEHPQVKTPVAVLVQILWETMWLAFIYHVVVIKCRQGFWQGLQWATRPISTSAYLFYGVALSLGIQLVSQMFPKREGLPIERMFDTPASAYLLAFFGICVAPFMEELVFRGFLFPVLERRWGMWAAVLLTGGVFAAIHIPQLGGWGSESSALLSVGLIFSLVRARTGSLKPSFLMHLGYNSTLFVLLFISTNRFQTLAQ